MRGGMSLVSSVARSVEALVEGGRKTNKSLKGAVLGGTTDKLHRYCYKSPGSAATNTFRVPAQCS